MSRNEAEKAVSVVSFISNSLGVHYNGTQIAKFRLLIDRTSPIYLNVRLNNSFFFDKFLHKLCLMCKRRDKKIKR
jgi:hypothetical protein